MLRIMLYGIMNDAKDPMGLFSTFIENHHYTGNEGY